MKIIWKGCGEKGETLHSYVITVVRPLAWIWRGHPACRATLPSYQYQRYHGSQWGATAVCRRKKAMSTDRLVELFLQPLRPRHFLALFGGRGFFQFSLIKCILSHAFVHAR